MKKLCDWKLLSVKSFLMKCFESVESFFNDSGNCFIKGQLDENWLVGAPMGGSDLLCAHDTRDRMWQTLQPRARARWGRFRPEEAYAQGRQRPTYTVSWVSVQCLSGFSAHALPHTFVSTCQACFSLWYAYPSSQKTCVLKSLLCQKQVME